MRTQSANKLEAKMAAVVIAMVLSLFGVYATFATDAYLTVYDAQYTTSFTNCANWRIGSESGSPLGTAAEPIKSGYNYIVSGKTLRTPLTSATFGGDSLTIQGGGTLAVCVGGAGREYTFPGGIVLKANLVSWSAGSPVIKGKVTIPTGVTAKVYDNATGSVLTFDGELAGESTSTMWVYGYNGNNTKTTVLFKGDTLRNYPGNIVCCSRDGSGTPTPVTASTIKIGNVTSSAKVSIRDYCKISAETASDVVSIDTLEMKTNTTMTVVYSKSAKTTSCIKVTGTFTHSEGPVKIDVTGNGSTSDCVWPDSALPILKAPAGVTLSTNDFTVVAAWPAYDLSVQTTEDGLSTLFIRQHGKVIQQQYDDVQNQRDTSSFCSGDKWEGGDIPDQYNCYYSARGTQRAYGSPFPGYTLARQTGIIALQIANVRIDDFRIVGSSVQGMGIYAYYNGATLEGRLRLVSANNFTPLAGHAGTLTVASEIDGPGRIQIYGKTSANISTVKITNTNDFFTGRIESAVKSGNTPSDTIHSVLEFADGRSLGGAMPAWTYNGHTFNAYTYFKPLATTTLERENCGIFADGVSRIVCDDGITLTVRERTTWNGEIKKLGTGTLAWGGAQPYFTTNGGTTPVSGNNSLVIAEGVLRPASSEAFRGVAVTIADGAGIGVEVQADDTTDLAKYGMDLRPDGSSLTIEAASITPVVSVPDGMRGTRIAAICTVPAESAAAVRGKLNTSSYLISNNICIQGFERVNEDTSVTFGVKAKKLGTIIMFY